MIISHKYRYVFVELQRTASMAVRKELMENYAGKEILKKNTGFHTFLKSATREEKKYFVFSGVRNPLDRTISFYEKLKSDPNNYISDIEYQRKKNLAERYFFKQYKYIQENNASFSQYLKKFYYFPYDDRSCLHHSQFDYVYRFETIQDDFAKILKRIGIEQVRPLPVVNRTKGKSTDQSVYLDMSAREQVVRVFGPFMEKWGYDMPFDGINAGCRWTDRSKFRFFAYLRSIYYKYIM